VSITQAIIADIANENREEDIWRVALMVTLSAELKKAGSDPKLRLDLSSIDQEARGLKLPNRPNRLSP
jgi:hypothetical protein